MPTCRDIITRALRKAKVYSPGEDPTAEDMADGLDELQNLYEQWGANGMFGRLTDTVQEDGYEAEAFQRIQIASGTVTLPTERDDDDELPPYSLSFIEVVNTGDSTVTRYLYENGAWVTISDLSLEDEAPLAGRGSAGLAACLAMALAEEYGAELGPLTARQAAAFKIGLATRHGSDAPRTGSDFY